MASITWKLGCAVTYLISLLAIAETVVGVEANCQEMFGPNGSCGWLAQVSDSDRELARYNERLQQQISQEWNPLSSDRAGEVTVEFSIQRDGSISELKIQQSSGDSDVDAATLETIRAAVPFDPLPPSYQPGILPIVFTFATKASNNIDPSYMESVKAAIAERWSPDPTEKPRRVSLQFEITRDGTVNNLIISTPSGDSAFDKLAIEAISMATPFNSLPDDYAGDLLPINYTLSSSQIIQPNVPEGLQAYDCLEITELETSGPTHIDPGNYNNETLILRGDVTNECDVGFEVAAWRATIFPETSDVELGGKTALVRSILPGETQTISFFVKFGELNWTNDYTPARILSEGFRYGVYLSSLSPMVEE